jgi:hypothetical protein
VTVTSQLDPAIVHVVEGLNETKLPFDAHSTVSPTIEGVPPDTVAVHETLPA